jgi:hypothetical protein
VRARKVLDKSIRDFVRFDELNIGLAVMNFGFDTEAGG